MFQFGFKSDKGMIRELNQDSFFVMPDEGIYLVADGVGGQSQGELASRTAVSDIAAFIKENPVPHDAGGNRLEDYFDKLINMVNEHIFAMSRDGSPGRGSGMATTLVLLCIRQGEAYMANVGDSRIYIIRDAGLTQLTVDHTYVNDLVKRGIITEDEARNHPDKNMITRALGADVTVKPDFYRQALKDGDIVLMCTDGLYNEVPEERMLELAGAKKDLRELCTSLVEEANRNGGRDNITVVAVKI